MALVFSQRASRRSGSCSIISRDFITAATDAGGRLALNMRAREVCLRKSISFALPAMKPPTVASDLLNVPIMASILSCRPKCAAVPSPFGPMTPREWASSTITAVLYFSARGTIRGRSAISPSMLNIPSMTINLPASRGIDFKTVSRLEGSLCSKRFNRPNERLAPSIMLAWSRRSANM